MIIVALLNLIKLLLDLIFNILPNLPPFPSSLNDAIEYVLNIIFDSLSLIGVFVHMETVAILLPLALLVINFNRIYHIVMWLVKKIPALNIK